LRNWGRDLDINGFQTREDMSYLAGLVDGEGCFYLAHSKNSKGYIHKQPRLIVCNTNYDIMLWLKDTFGGYITTRKHKNPKWKTIYQWIITDNKALMLANWLEPLLIIKKDQVKKLWDGHKVKKIVCGDTPIMSNP